MKITFSILLILLLTTGCSTSNTFEAIETNENLEVAVSQLETHVTEEISGETEEPEIEAGEEITFEVEVPKANISKVDPKPIVTTSPTPEVKKVISKAPATVEKLPSAQETPPPPSQPEVVEIETEPAATEETEKVSGKEVLPPEQARYNFGDPTVDFWAYMAMDVKPWIEWGSSAKDPSTKEERINYVSQSEWGRKGLDYYGYDY